MHLKFQQIMTPLLVIQHQIQLHNFHHYQHQILLILLGLKFSTIPNLTRKDIINIQQAPIPNNHSPNPSHPSPSPPPINYNQSSILPALVEVWKSIDSRIAGNDHALYIKILNSYFIENGYPGFKTPQCVIDAINNHPPSIPSPQESCLTKSDPPPIPQPPHPPNPNPTSPPPETPSPNDAGNDEIDIEITSNNVSNNAEFSNGNTDSENENEISQYNSDEESTTVPPQGKTNLKQYSPMTLRSHPKIKKIVAYSKTNWLS